ncbi:Murein DD-endopeptidase MepM [Grimontia celer]|uniref:Murein DD-endopeptidase MepM n=1 Tax=Grimontia celer TaxID=1796497 RepID=A0A128EWJ5_9GAMM|nr:peptidoglycan DD-metalloendopeptidase family protein [Grimontia celer]CZF78962.1 Murein DD-endopeptidase MepM [Grimontia celer]
MKHFKPIALLTAVFAFTLAFFIPDADKKSIEATEPTPDKIELPLTVQTDGVESKAGSTETPKAQKIDYIVKVGDTLSEIFSSLQLPYSALLEILAADEPHLQLDTIKPGDHLSFTVLRETMTLQKLSYHISLVEQATFTLEDEGGFIYEFVEMPSEWREVLYSGTVEGSFSLSAHKVGLSSNQIANITNVLKDKLDFTRSLRAGDRFNILVNKQFLGDHPTGNNQIQAISFNLSNREVAAFLADDGRFYDRSGNSLERAFNRYPIDKKYRRITSAFNPKRKHPVTGRVTPHNGTDFATPVGAPVYSTGDGKVVSVRNHPYAGKYLVIEHNSVYKTRYLHLHKILVKRGQRIERGQKIALSGATGRLTGPHLHYEVLVRNRAVDPMKANLPIASSISQENLASFQARISEFDLATGNQNLSS